MSGAPRLVSRAAIFAAIFAPFALLLPASCASTSATRLSPVEIREAPVELSEALCSAAAVVASPTGRYAATFDSSAFETPSRFALSLDVVGIVSDACFGSESGCTPVVSRTSRPPTSLAWSVDEASLYAVDEELRVARIPIRETADIEWLSSGLPSASSRVSLDYLGPSESLTLSQERERIDSALTVLVDAAGDLREISVSLHTSGLLPHAAILDRAFQWRRFDIGTRAAGEGALPHPLFPMLRPQINVSGEREFVSAGVVFNGELNAKPASPYARPIVDARTGRRIGVHDERNVHFLDGSPSITLGMGDAWSIRSASRAGSRLYLLARDVNGDAALVLIGDEKVALRARCSSGAWEGTLMPLEGEDPLVVTLPGTTHSTIVWRRDLWETLAQRLGYRDVLSNAPSGGGLQGPTIRLRLKRSPALRLRRE